MFKRKPDFLYTTQRVGLKLPSIRDFDKWVMLRTQNSEFLRPWEPKRHDDQSSKQSFSERVKWADKSFKTRTALSLLICDKESAALMGAITLDNVRRGPSMSGTVGYWLGQQYAGQGFMQEVLTKVVTLAFNDFDLSRIEAATLKDNKPSRKLLERSGFKYEGVAQSYYQIDGRWRPHVLYANIRRDRIGTTDQGVF